MQTHDPIINIDPGGHVTGRDRDNGYSSWFNVTEVAIEQGYRRAMLWRPGSLKAFGQKPFNSWDPEQYETLPEDTREWMEGGGLAYFEHLSLFTSLFGLDREIPTKNPSSWAPILDAWAPWIDIGFKMVFRDAGSRHTERSASWNLHRHSEHNGIECGTEAIMLEANVLHRVEIPQMLEPRTYESQWVKYVLGTTHAPRGSRIHIMLSGAEWANLEMARLVYRWGGIPVLNSRLGRVIDFGPEQIMEGQTT